MTTFLCGKFYGHDWSSRHGVKNRSKFGINQNRTHGADRKHWLAVAPALYSAAAKNPANPKQKTWCASHLYK